MQVALAGVLRRSEKPSMFVPENNRAKGAWYWLDVPALAQACNLPADTPLLEVRERLDSNINYISIINIEGSFLTALACLAEANVCTPTPSVLFRLSCSRLSDHESGLKDPLHGPAGGRLPLMILEDGTY